MKVNPFDNHPESDPGGKKDISILLSLEEIRESINAIVEQLKTQRAPIWGYNKRNIEILFENLYKDLETKCHID